MTDFGCCHIINVIVTGRDQTQDLAEVVNLSVDHGGNLVLLVLM
jgi:hypothetical protein